MLTLRTTRFPTFRHQHRLVQEGRGGNLSRVISQVPNLFSFLAKTSLSKSRICLSFLNQEEADQLLSKVQQLEFSYPITAAGDHLPRSTHWSTMAPCSCPYKYGQVRVPASPMQPWFIELSKKLEAFFEVPQDLTFNCCNINKYVGGLEAVGWHSDNEALFQATKHPTLIVSLTLGESRPFEIRQCDTNKSNSSMLGHGDLATMEGLFQKEFVHRAPQVPYAQGIRYNLTWRTIKKHVSECECKSRDNY